MYSRELNNRQDTTGEDMFRKICKKLNKRLGKSVVSVLALVILFSMSFIGTAYSKVGTFYVEFDFDSDFPVSEFVLYQVEPTTQALVEVHRITDTTLRSFNTPNLDLSPGEYTEFVLSAVYDDATEANSVGYNYKFIGKPSVNAINWNK